MDGLPSRKGLVSDRQVQFAEKEQHTNTQRAEAAQAACVGDHPRHERVHALRGRVGDPVLQIVEQTPEAVGKHVGDLLERFEFRALHGTPPILEELLRRCLIDIIPEGGECLLEPPCLAGLQIGAVKLLERRFAPQVGEVAGGDLKSA